MNIDHGELEGTIGDLLDRYKLGTIEKVAAIDEISHVIQAVAQGNENEFLAFIRSHKGANDR
ncbi:MAG: hypothetical protein ABJM43_00420 [Paracoccaceae bacterium]